MLHTVEAGLEGQQRQRRHRALLEVGTQRAEDVAGQPLEELDHDVADESVADDHVGDMADHVVPLHVADEVQPRLLDASVGLARQGVALLRLLADVEQADARARHLQDVLRVDGSHHRVMDQVVGLGVDVGAHVEEQDRPAGGDEVGSQRRAVDPLDATQPEDGGGHRGAGRAGADQGVGQAEVRIGIGLVAVQAAAEPVGRLRVVLLLVIGLPEVPRRDLRRRVGGIVEGGEELRLSLLPLAREHQRHAEVVAHVGVVRVQHQRLAERAHRVVEPLEGGVREAEALVEVRVLGVLPDGVLEFLQRELGPPVAEVGQPGVEPGLGVAAGAGSLGPGRGREAGRGDHGRGNIEPSNDPHEPPFL